MNNKEMKFNVGDRVKKKNGKGFGAALFLYSTITRIELKSDNSYRYKVKDSVLNFRYSELILQQKATPQNKEIEFNVGDKVIRSDGTTWSDGDKYKIIRLKEKLDKNEYLNPKEYLFLYKLEGMGTSWYCDEIELYEEEEEEEELCEEEEEIELYEEEEEEEELCEEEEEEELCEEEEEELCEGEEEMKFNIGDRVKKKCGIGFGVAAYSCSTITNIELKSDNSYRYKVKDSERNYRGTELILQQKAMPQNKEIEFNVGDNKLTLTDFSFEELEERLKTIEEEVTSINNAIREKKKVMEKEKGDLTLMLKTTIKRMEELGMNISELIKE